MGMNLYGDPPRPVAVDDISPALSASRLQKVMILKSGDGDEPSSEYTEENKPFWDRAGVTKEVRLREMSLEG